MIVGLLSWACVLLVVVVVWALRVHHVDRIKVSAWEGDWFTAHELCAWRTDTGPCLRQRTDPTHITPDEIRDPRRSVQQTKNQHPFIEARLMTRYAGSDPALLALSMALKSSERNAKAQKVMARTDSAMDHLARYGWAFKTLFKALNRRLRGWAVEQKRLARTTMGDDHAKETVVVDQANPHDL